MFGGKIKMKVGLNPNEPKVEGLSCVSIYNNQGELLFQIYSDEDDVICLGMHEAGRKNFHMEEDGEMSFGFDNAQEE